MYSSDIIQQLLQGLSGKDLKLNPEWTNPSGIWKIGLKDSSEFLPKDALKRIKDSFTKEMTRINTNLISRAAQSTTPPDVEAAVDSSKSDAEKELQKHESLYKVQVLQDYAKSCKMPNLMIDCVVFHDGQDWRAVIDTTGSISSLK